MKLNLPILDQLADSQNILIAGAGGGFDVYVGLPLYFELRALGKNVHLANYSFTDVEMIYNKEVPFELVPDGVLGVSGPVKNRIWLYYPEGYLAQWFHEVHGDDLTVWVFPKLGGAPLAEAYRALADHLKIDTLILVDGGVDSIMRGDEAGPGTMIEDSISLAAASTLDVPVKILACLGFGTEIEEGLCHHHALENIAALTQVGGFYGSCSLLPQMDSFQQFEAACRYVWEQPHHAKSHITTRVIPAAHGEFGNFRMYPDANLDGTGRIPILVSPLMSIYWFFDAHKVIERNLLIHDLLTTTSTRHAMGIFMQVSQTIKQRRPRQSLPY
jgi:hypothetical protein